jgi:predicted GNAT family N-acyltransferase
MENIKIERYGFENAKLSSLSNSIRQKVFVKEQNVDPEIEYDEFEEEAHYLLLFYNDHAIGTARWRENDKGIKLERFALLPEYRNKGLGSILLREILKDVTPLQKTIYLHAQVTAVNYYEREGFVKEGNIFIEADIEHYLMKHKE